MQQVTSINTGSVTSYKEASSNDDDVTFSITQLAEEFGVTTRAIRFYEDKDLLHPTRNGQTRVYRPRDRARLFLIVRGKAVGFSLGEIKELIDLHDTYGDEREYVIAAEKFKAQINALEAQKLEIDEQIKLLEDGVARFSKLAKEAAKVA